MSSLVLACADGIAGVAHDDWLWLGDADIRVVPDLCRDPDVITRRVDGAADLVLAFCSANPPRGPVQAAVRGAGLDPLGVEVVDLRNAAGDVERLTVILEAAVARARAFAGSSPGNTRMILSKDVTRRSILTLRLAEYVTVPSIEPARCVADRGCRACVEACPSGAIGLSGAGVSVDPARCDPCGLCTTACLVEAVVDPTITSAQLDAQVRALLDPSIGPVGPRGIVFTCRRSRLVETTPGWFPVVVPCAGAAPASWLLAPLLLGASAIAVRPCGDAGCPFGRDEVVHERVSFSRRFLAAIGWSEDRVAAAPGEMPLAPIPGSAFAADDAFAPGAAGRVLQACAERGGDHSAFAVEHRGSPVGVVEIRTDSCTGCGMCARSCPTEALVLAPRDGAVDITFEGLSCTGCGQCVGSCPEVDRGAIGVRRLTSRDILSRGPTRLVESEVASCRRCGRHVAPMTMLRRVSELLGPGEERTMRIVESYCLDCRAIGLPVTDRRAPRKVPQVAELEPHV